MKNDLKNKFFESCKKYEDEIEVNEFGHDRYVSIVTINLKHTDKAYAILELLMILNKKESDTIIFGDNYADINMLKLNGITVAMANGITEAKEAAKYVSEYDNNHNGVTLFLHKIENGSVDKSYGIHVARLANLPESLIKRASQILAVYENKEKVRDNKIQESLPLEELMEPKENEIQKVIDEINPLEITPLEALNILYDLKNKIRR